MNESRRLQGLPSGLVGHFESGKLAKFVVNKWEQFLGGFGVTVLHAIEDGVTSLTRGRMSDDGAKGESRIPENDYCYTSSELFPSFPSVCPQSAISRIFSSFRFAATSERRIFRNTSLGGLRTFCTCCYCRGLRQRALVILTAKKKTELGTARANEELIALTGHAPRRIELTQGCDRVGAPLYIAQKSTLFCCGTMDRLLQVTRADHSDEWRVWFVVGLIAMTIHYLS